MSDEVLKCYLHSGEHERVPFIKSEKLKDPGG